METFKEFYDTVEDEKEMLNEEAIEIALAVLGLPSVIALIAWVGSLALTTYIRGLGKITKSIANMWSVLFTELKSDKITQQDAEDAIKNLARDPKAENIRSKNERNKTAFKDELTEVLNAIEKKDFDLAAIEFKKTGKYIQNNPDVHKVIISELSRVIGELPMYVTSPGNETYKAIKKIINIKVAKSAAYATKFSITRELNNKIEEEDAI